jgi:uncharacterized OB-fold protein
LSSQPEKIDLFQRDAGGKILPTIENFYRFCAERKLMGVKCSKCGAVFVLPRMTCPKCHFTGMQWIELKGAGKLLSYSIVYVSTQEYQSQTPYAVGIVELDEGARLSGVVRNVKHEDLKIGMNLAVDFEDSTSQEWPQWPRYFFRSR